MKVRRYLVTRMTTSVQKSRKPHAKKRRWTLRHNASHAKFFRQYSYDWARWLSPDPAGLAAVDLSNPQSLNRYAYALNAPTTYIDPLGLETQYFFYGGCIIRAESHWESKTNAETGAISDTMYWTYDAVLCSGGGGGGGGGRGGDSGRAGGGTISKLLNNSAVDWLGKHSNWLPGACSASLFAYGTTGPDINHFTVQGGVLIQGEVPLVAGGSPRKSVDAFGEIGTPVGGIGGTPSGETFLFAHKPGSNNGPVVAFDRTNWGINNSGIFLGWFAGGDFHYRAGKVPMAAEFGGGGGVTFSNAANCVAASLPTGGTRR